MFANVQSIGAQINIHSRDEMAETFEKQKNNKDFYVGTQPASSVSHQTS